MSASPFPRLSPSAATTAVLAPVPFKVLSINSYMMGHITYQDTLERVLGEQFPEICFDSIHLPPRVRGEPVLRLLLRVSRIRVPWVRKGNRDFFRLRFECGMSLVTLFIVLREISRGGYDVVHLHTQAIALLGPLLPKAVKYVVSLDATTALLARERAHSFGEGLRGSIWLERRTFNRAAHIVAWSERARQSVISDYGIAPGKVTVLPPGAPFLSQKEREPKAFAEGGKVRMLFVGNDFERKGGRELVAAFARGFGVECELHIVSNGTFDLKPMPSMFVHKGLTPACPELVALYAKADIFVLPTWHDCFGLAFVEAMAAGLPCIGTSIMAVPEIVQDGRTGFTVPPGDVDRLHAAIARLVEDAPLREEMGRAGLERVRMKFDPVRNTGLLLELFRKAAAAIPVS